MYSFSTGPAIAVDLSFKEERLASVKLSLFSHFVCRWDGHGVVEPFLNWLEAYSQKKPHDLPLQYDNLSSFQKKALDALRTVPLGHTISYGHLASLAGSPRGARAIGNACNQNPYPLFIPCHRVIASTGKIGGFALDLDIKKRLLAFELSSNK